MVDPRGFISAPVFVQQANASSTLLAVALLEQQLSTKTFAAPIASGASQSKHIPFKQRMGAFDPRPVDPPKTTGGSGTR